MISDEIVKIASSYLGQREDPTETTNNERMQDPSYQKKLADVGWKSGYEWCAAAACVVWAEAYAPYPVLASEARKNYHVGSLDMARNFEKDKAWVTNKNTPKIGAMAIFDDGDGTGHGHVGIVVQVLPDGKTYGTIEGNSIDAKTGEDNIVAAHMHTVGNLEVIHGKRTRFLRCFIYPNEPVIV